MKTKVLEKESFANLQVIWNQAEQLVEPIPTKDLISSCACTWLKQRGFAAIEGDHSFLVASLLVVGKYLNTLVALEGERIAKTSLEPE